MSSWADWAEPHVRRLLALDWGDDEIIDEMGHLRPGRLGRVVGEPAHGLTLRERRLVEQMLAALRGTPAVRSRAVADPRAAFDVAVVAIRRRSGRLTKAAVATEMGLDRGTLNTYIDNDLVPAFPWEGYEPT